MNPLKNANLLIQSFHQSSGSLSYFPLKKFIPFINWDCLNVPSDFGMYLF